MTTLRTVAGYLPGLAREDVQWQTLAFESAAGRVDVEVPVLSARQMTALAQRVKRASRLQLRTMTVSQIVDVIDRAIARLLDPDDPYRQQADRLLPITSGYNAGMIRLGLTSLFKTFRAPQLQRFVAEDFANPKMLDEFQPRPKGGAARAFGPELLVHSWAGNVPALPLWSLVCAMLVKAGSIGKLPSAEPLFAGLFARLLAEVHPPLADCLAVVWWKGGDTEQSAALYREADTVLAYGGNDALDEIRRQLPVTTRFLPHGHKLGFGVIGIAALDTLRGPATARLAAHDVMRFDQQGCYSPHVFYVERGGQVSPREFAQYLASELANLQHRFPRSHGLEVADRGHGERVVVVAERVGADDRTVDPASPALPDPAELVDQEVVADGAQSQHPGGRRHRPGRGRSADRGPPSLLAKRRPGRRAWPAVPVVRSARRSWRHAHQRHRVDDLARGWLAPRRPLQFAGPGAHRGDRAIGGTRRRSHRALRRMTTP